MNGKEQTLYVKYLFPFKYQQLNSASFLKSLTDIFGLGSLGGSFFSPVLSLSTGLGFWFPCLSSSLSRLCLCQYFPCICELLDTSPRNIFAARMTEDKLDSEVDYDYVGDSVKVTGSRVEDVESPIKHHNPALNLCTCSPSPSPSQDFPIKHNDY